MGSSSHTRPPGLCGGVVRSSVAPLGWVAGAAGMDAGGRWALAHPSRRSLANSLEALQQPAGTGRVGAGLCLGNGPYTELWRVAALHTLGGITDPP